MLQILPQPLPSRMTKALTDTLDAFDRQSKSQSLRKPTWDREHILPAWQRFRQFANAIATQSKVSVFDWHVACVRHRCSRGLVHGAGFPHRVTRSSFYVESSGKWGFALGKWLLAATATLWGRGLRAKLWFEANTNIQPYYMSPYLF